MATPLKRRVADLEENLARTDWMGFDTAAWRSPIELAQLVEAANRYSERRGVTYEAAFGVLIANLSDDDLARLIAEIESQGGSK